MASRRVAMIRRNRASLRRDALERGTNAACDCKKSARVRRSETGRPTAGQSPAPVCDAVAGNIGRPNRGNSERTRKEPSQRLYPSAPEPTSARELAFGSEARNSSDGCVPCAASEKMCVDGPSEYRERGVLDN